MIRFFRKIRKRLIQGNKVVKYILYASGETLLVVVGILIALNVNNWNEQSKTKKKIDVIFESIKLDLVDGINEANSLTKLYEESDSLQQLVLNNKVTDQDYRTNQRLRTLIMFYQLFWTNQTGYDALKRNIDDIPNQYANLLSDLNQLYSRIVPAIQMNNNLVRNQLHSTLQKWATNYNWFQTSKETYTAANDSMINFFINDPKYKNDVRMYKMVTIDNLLMSMRQYKLWAMSSFFKINLANGVPLTNSLIEFKNHVNEFTEIKLLKYSISDSISRVPSNKHSFLLIKNNLNKDLYLYYRNVNGNDQLITSNRNMIGKNDMQIIGIMSNNNFLVKDINGAILGTFNSSPRTGYLIIN